MSVRAYLFAVLITISIVAIVVRQVRRHRVKPKYALIWIAASCVLLPVGLIPGLLDVLARFVGISYGPALLLVMGLGFFAIMSMQFSADLTKLDERTRVLAEEVALLRSGPRHETSSGADRASAADASIPRIDVDELVSEIRREIDHGH